MTIKKPQNNPSLHKDLKWVTTAMQLLAMFPVQNIRAKNSDLLQFRFLSIGFFYFTFCWSCVFFIGTIYLLLMVNYYGVQIWSVGKRLLSEFWFFLCENWSCSSYSGNVGRFDHGLAVFGFGEKLARLAEKMEENGVRDGEVWGAEGKSVKNARADDCCCNFNIS